VPGYYTEVGLIALQAKQLGITVPIFGGDGWESSSLVPIGGAALEGDYFSTHFSPEDTSPAVQNFVKEYKAKYGRNARCHGRAGLRFGDDPGGRDQTRRLDGRRENPRRARREKDFPGVSGNITIDANRNASKPAVILTIKNGAFKYVQAEY
jgi:branched-chain amino acid transport system substrate-binding protein